MQRLPWMAIAVALAGLMPATASAAKLELVGGNQFHYVAGPGELNFNFLQVWDQKVLIQEGVNYGVVNVEAVSPCAAEPQVPAGSPQYSCPAAGITSAYVDMGDQNDEITFGGMGPFLLPVTVEAGEGNDDIFSRNGLQDKIDCGPGSDHVRADDNDLLTNCESVERTFTPTGESGWTRADGKRIGVSVNGGAAFTNDPVVDVVAYGPDAAKQTLISNDGGFAEPVAFPATMPTFPWRLPETGAERLPKTVYVRFEGGGIDNTRTFSDDIILDQTAPVVKDAHVHAGKLAIRARDATSGLAAMQFRMRGGKMTSFRKFAAVTRVRGSAPRFVRVRDRARNVSRWRAVSR